MPQETARTVWLLLLVTPNFNLMATVALVDPLRAANYLAGVTHFKWVFASVGGGTVMASNGLSVNTRPLKELEEDRFDIVVVSSSWSPESHASPQLLVALRKWARQGVVLGALDTGAFILAEAGLLRKQAATVHYEHIDALQELYDDIEVSENIFTLGKGRFTCCGGTAAADMGLELVRAHCDNALANAAARYVFHPVIRGESAPQNPSTIEPLGHTTPTALRQIIAEMERNLEEPLPIPELCDRIGLSQRHVSRMFERYVGKTAVLYYRDIRLDRARGLVTQTNLQLSQVAAATGFASQAHFSQAYKSRFGISPRSDRLEGRIPFEFRAWPMHRRQGDGG
ncbi:transcriptional regulator, AraC family with amidase-like domain [Paracoccus halophilus]|uniref:AraC family transcriptional regulator n=1 Tax=Paracoccus halophilus TaxID=376733 RepID=A0A099EXS3_9RHOB|nr:GlxA family transcriptional regulator [Paracoccus halophilus]KGJ03240.1 AraC family transcriptional regulator [Paracoccus halophilus]SFA52746.1 transcriptional regulator, AraC family with amidase-like domain [Paracoccus halophilus]